MKKLCVLMIVMLLTSVVQATLTKSVTPIWPSKNSVGIRVVITDDDRADLGVGVQTVIDQTFSENFTEKLGLTIAIRDSLFKKAQKAIDRYRKNKALFRKAAYTVGVTWIETNLDLTKEL